MVRLKKFLDSENGAVTVDWVVITSAIATLALLVVLTITIPAVNFGRDVGDHVANQSLLQY